MGIIISILNILRGVLFGIDIFFIVKWVKYHRMTNDKFNSIMKSSNLYSEDIIIVRNEYYKYQDYHLLSSKTNNYCLKIMAIGIINCLISIILLSMK